MLVLFFIIASASLTIPVTNAASNCSVCELGDYFTELNGYGCVDGPNGTVACTCPDKIYTLDYPCRICDRLPNICGDDPNAFCAETTPLSLGVQNNDSYFACFCSDFTFRVGQACPSMATPEPEPTEN